MSWAAKDQFSIIVTFRQIAAMAAAAFRKADAVLDEETRETVVSTDHGTVTVHASEPHEQDSAEFWAAKGAKL